jgi:hypothetical protein
MTRISLLEDQKAIFTAQKEELENKRSDIYVREQKAISDALLPFFKDFSKEVTVEVSRGSVYFKMAHPEVSYLKELFNLYLRENWNFDTKKQSFNGIDLSYYTTSTKGVDEWELRRLRMLGDLAEIVLMDQDNMLDAVNEAVLPFKEEYDRVYAQMSLVSKATKELNEKITAVKKERIEFDLKNGGVEFVKGASIQLKFNYTPYVKSVQLIDLSKSGKKGTVVFEFGHGGGSSREENCNVSSIVDQVLGFTKDIVQHTLAE